eukprot:TRINITY_DN94001_c0_g1_i1.p1 TRINITY_DN94001_c0_g1~~TRINITY_DN94001_c0_g1_i1.p1  ORF type:complete len:101 (-),score=7.87 TRINITY_DN94001_c0_g1_i1:34-336(-)
MFESGERAAVKFLVCEEKAAGTSKCQAKAHEAQIRPNGLFQACSAAFLASWAGDMRLVLVSFSFNSAKLQMPYPDGGSDLQTLQMVAQTSGQRSKELQWS